MQTEILIGADKVMDVRAIPCSVKHGQIVKTWLDTPFRYPPARLSLAGLRRALRFLLGD